MIIELEVFVMIMTPVIITYKPTFLHRATWKIVKSFPYVSSHFVLSLKCLSLIAEHI